MSILSIRDLTIAFGGSPLLDNVHLVIHRGDRIGLLGRNGEGKTTLLRLINGEFNPDHGEFERIPGFRVAKLDQEVPEKIEGTVFHVVIEGLGDIASLLEAYHEKSVEIANDENGSGLDELNDLQHRLESRGGWEAEQNAEQIITRLNLDSEALFDKLSGGQKRRALLARALVTNPDLLLLDEPTNHLDIAAIRWLETFLKRTGTTLLFVTHDRAFLRSQATRIIELDRGNLTNWSFGYERYLEAKADSLREEERNHAAFDKKLEKEEVWIRQGIKARRTRNEGRVRALTRLRNERKKRRERLSTVNFNLQDANRSGQKVITVENIGIVRSGINLVEGFSTTIWRGDRIGIMGPNGSGKTTLLKVILGMLPPDTGMVRHGTNLETTYYDQLRDQLDDSKSVWENVCEFGDTVTVNGRSRHVIPYLQDFLFPPEIVHADIFKLSGGERNRLLLAKLFTRPANVFVFDEPTNDLDIDTLELLEGLLQEYTGTLMLVSHDREFLNNLVSSIISIEGVALSVSMPVGMMIG